MALLVAAPALLVGLLVTRKKNRVGPVIVFKTVLSFLFVLLALTASYDNVIYYRLILSGLVLALVGDVCLAIPRRVAFKVGLGAFLIAHVLYIVAFAGLSSPEEWWPVALMTEAVFIGGVFLTWLRPHLGNMRIPVFLYTATAGLTLAGAISLFLNAQVARSGAVVILAGTSLFIVSDLFVARHRFITPSFVNRLYGLPLYYAGQFLLAFSVTLV
jgi:uncharacterized membrane protein YhhN